MKRFLLITLFSIVLYPVFGDLYPYDWGGLTFEVPEEWSFEPRKDSILLLETPEELMQLMTWDVGDQAEILGPAAVVKIAAEEFFTEFEVVGEEDLDLNGLEGYVAYIGGLYEGRPVGGSFLVIKTGEYSGAVFIVFGTERAWDKYSNDVSAIFMTLNTPWEAREF